MNKSLWAAAAALSFLVATPAPADVKAGVDAWARGDYARAISEWRGPAEAGDADAQFNLGQAYKLGRGVPVDLVQAERWYRLAALQGHPQAEDNYGLALFQNNKRAEALPWLSKSAGRGEPRAQFVLGTMYFNGDGVTKDWVRAYALMLRAAAQGLPQASQTQAQMDRYIPMGDRQAGIQLAKRYEAEASRPQTQVAMAPIQPRPTAPVATSQLPPSNAYRPEEPEVADAGPPPQDYPPQNYQPAPYQPEPQPAPPRPRPRPAAPAPVVQERPAAPVASGRWRIQLGAFGDPGNARKLWAQVGGRFPGRQPYYVKAGAVTRLLVGPFASSGEANRACAAVKPCLPVAP